MRGRVDFAIRRLFYSADGLPLDVAAVRGRLADLLLDNIHGRIDRELITSTLATHGIRLRGWAIEKSVRDRIDAICDSYTDLLKSELINQTFLPLPGWEPIRTVGVTPASQKILVAGAAGAGKSTMLAEMISRLRAQGIAVMTVRFDQLPDGILTTTELGHKLLLPESPALVLAGVAAGAPSVLVIDQLDAVSIASGRRTELWTLFDQLCNEALQFPSMSLVVACREFDLEHDHRMRRLKAQTPGFVTITLGQLSAEQVDNVLRDAGTDPTSVQPTLKPILSVPLHLSMFLRLPPTSRVGVRNRDELFDCFWTEGEQRTDQRLGRKAGWTQVIDRLATWLSENQQLTAPRHVLDDFTADAGAMASQHILILADDRYGFFHESFFDYAFARRFAARGGCLTDLLLGGEQQLFRRAQVRQVLAYLRAQDWPRYLQELQAVLAHRGIRFHIKRLVFQWLSSLPEPQSQEWDVLQRVLESEPDLRSHIQSVIAGHPGWFDVLDNAGFFDAALSSGEKTREEEVVWIFGFPATLEARSARIASLLRKYRKTSEQGEQYLRYVCRTGHVYHAREMFDLFLSLVDDGTLDDLRPGLAVNDDWWSALHWMADKRPDMACEAIGHWFDRRLLTYRISESKDGAPAEEGRHFGEHLDASGNGVHIVHKAAESALRYAEQMLPRVVRFVSETAKETAGRLAMDALWSFRSFGDGMHQVHHALLSGLAQSLEELAKTRPEELDRLLEPYRDQPYDTVAYLTLRAWTAAPDFYADRLADYMTADPRRLKIGYATWGGGGSAQNYVSSEAVRAASARCSSERFAALEQAILSLKDDWEAKHPQIRGRKELELLHSLERSRVGTVALARLAELGRKFPAAQDQPPRAVVAGFVGSPIAEHAQAKMSDDHWLRAMQKYAGVDARLDREMLLAGGESQLAASLHTRAKEDPVRFASLAGRMPDDLPVSYFDAIVGGVSDSLGGGKGSSGPTIAKEQVASLLRRVHALPNRPCGKSIAWLIEKCSDRDWPDDLVDAVAWYAVNDPHPNKEVWNESATAGQPYYGGDPDLAGINSTRGAAAIAIGRLLFDRPEWFSRLQSAVESLVQDRSVAVRSCAIKPLLALLNIDVDKAICWFKTCITAHPILLSTPYVERFVHCAGYRDYTSVRCVLDAMLASTNATVVEAGARQVCILSLSVEAAAADAERVQNGTPPMRKAAAGVYAGGVADDMFGAVCRRRLKPFFADPEDSVRAEAASAFQHVATLATAHQAELLAGFLNAEPGRAALEPVVRALQNSPVQLPDLVCRLAKVCIDAYRAEAADISKAGSLIAYDLSKIVVRLYAHTEDSGIQSQCLSMIDEMERHHFMGLSEELRPLDR